MVDVILNKIYLPHSLNTSDDLIRIIQFTSSQFITNSSRLCQKEKKKKVTYWPTPQEAYQDPSLCLLAGTTCDCNYYDSKRGCQVK